MVRREIAPTSQALQVAFSRLFREPMLSESTSFGSRWGIYEMSSSEIGVLLLEPAVALEDGVERDGDQQHQQQRERVAERPVQFWHVIEVHPVNGAYQSRSEQDRGPGADLLHFLVLVDARLGQVLDLLVLLQTHQGKVNAQDVLQELSEAPDPLVDLYGVVQHVAQISLKLGVHLVLLEARDQVAQHTGEGLDSPLELDHLARELVDAPRDAGVAREDLDLYLVYVVLQAPDHRGVSVHHAVHDSVEDRLRPQHQQFGIRLQPPADLAQGRGLAVPDRYHEVLAHEDVDLPELHLLRCVQVPGGSQHDEQRLAVALKLRPLVRLQRVLHSQLVQPELFGDRGELLLGGPVKPYPGHTVLFA